MPRSVARWETVDGDVVEPTLPDQITVVTGLTALPLTLSVASCVNAVVVAVGGSAAVHPPGSGESGEQRGQAKSTRRIVKIS